VAELNDFRSHAGRRGFSSAASGLNPDAHRLGYLMTRVLAFLLNRVLRFWQ
jgi:hypothetical protein